MDTQDTLPHAEWLDEINLWEWDAFVTTSLQGSPYSIACWLRAFADCSPKNRYRVAVVRTGSGGISAGITLLLAKNRLGQTRAITPGYFPYNGLLVAPRQSTERDKLYRGFCREQIALLRLIRRLNLVSARFIHHPSVLDVRPFMWHGWQIRPAYTFLIDLKDWNGADSIARGLRKKFRRCQEVGYTFRAHQSLGGKAREFVELLEKTLVRQGLIIDPLLGGIDQYEKYLNSLDAHGALRYYEALSPNGQIASAQVAVPGFQHDIYAWLQATDPEHLRFGASTYLFVELFNHLKAEGWASFDFGGANTPRIAEFKQGFNGTLVAGHETQWESPKLFDRAIRAGGRLLHEAKTYAHHSLKTSARKCDHQSPAEESEI
jgi:hypothetical protein